MSKSMPAEQEAIDIETVELTEEPTTIVIEAIREYEEQRALLTSFGDSPDSDWSLIAHHVVGHEQEA